MSTNAPDKRKLRFANPQPLNLNTRVGHTIVDGGVKVGDWDNMFAGLGERLKREKDFFEEKNKFLYSNTQVLDRCTELGLSLDQVKQLAAENGRDILHVLGLDPKTLQPLRLRR